MNLSIPLVLTELTNVSYAPFRVAVCLIVFQNAWSLLVNACAASLLFQTSSGLKPCATRASVSTANDQSSLCGSCAVCGVVIVRISSIFALSTSCIFACTSGSSRNACSISFPSISCGVSSVFSSGLVIVGFLKTLFAFFRAHTLAHSPAFLTNVRPCRHRPQANACFIAFICCS